MYGLSTSLCLTHTHKQAHTQWANPVTCCWESNQTFECSDTFSFFFFWKWQHLFIRQREISLKGPTVLCQGRSGPVNWLLLTNKDVKSSIVHLFLYANEVQTQHALSFVSSPRPPSSLSLSDRFWCEDAMTGLLSFSLCSWHERCDRSQDQEAVMGSWESDCKQTHTHTLLQVSPHTGPNEG